MAEKHRINVTDRARQWSRSRSKFFRFGRVEDGSYRFSGDSLPAGFRVIGNGQVGGKARGLIFVLDRMANGKPLTEYDHLLRLPDSLVLATDVFDTFMIKNGLAKIVRARCREDIGPDELQQQIISAEFPDASRSALSEFLAAEHRPLVVRSSSIMEDDPEHSFAGIYLSEFVGNTGTEEDRLTSLVSAIKRVYASTFGKNARGYRKRHGLNWEREKMAILIQNMIGRHYPQDLFYPLIGGVAFSLNFYPWNDRLHAEDGVVRLVVGVGTRAVGREYARVFSPTAPGLRPEGSDERAIIRYSQETVDVLDMSAGQLDQTRLPQLHNPLLREVCSVVDSDGVLSEPVSSLPPEGRYIASFSRFIERNTTMPFSPLLRQLLSELQRLFEQPVDIEFAVNFPDTADGEETPLFYLLQARPLGGRPEHRVIRIPALPARQTLLSCNRVLGNGRRKGIHHLVFVDPTTYRWEEAYAIARRVGQIDQQLDDESYVLIGPGRWGTSNPQLGVPVQYGEITGASVIVEMATEAFSPELSYGTHFYADMVASGVLYLPFDGERGDQFNRTLLDRQQIVSADEFVRHVYFPGGLDAYADGKGKRGVIGINGGMIPKIVSRR